MHKEDKIRTAQLFLVTAQYFGRELPVLTAQMYQNDVDDLCAHDVKRALEALRRDPRRRNCPLPSEVRQFIENGVNAASPEESAARIVGAIGRFGYTRPNEAREFMGAIAWDACEQMGGWASICRRLQASELGTFSAQARELCRANLTRREREAALGLCIGQDEQKRLGQLNLGAIGR